MKKFRTILVTALAMLMVLFCFASCGKTGKYVATSYTVAGFNKKVEETDNPSYVELKGENVAVVSINLTSTLKWSGEGTWEEVEGKENTVAITVGVITCEAVIDGSTMTLDMVVGTITLEK